MSEYFQPASINTDNLRNLAADPRVGPVSTMSTVGPENISTEFEIMFAIISRGFFQPHPLPCPSPLALLHSVCPTHLGVVVVVTVVNKD